MIISISVAVFWISSILCPVVSQQSCDPILVNKVNSVIRFVSQDHSWCSAEISCNKMGGELLQVTNCAVQQAIRQQSHGNMYHWWVGQQLRNYSSTPNLAASEKLFNLFPEDNSNTQLMPALCTYITSDSQLVTTANCKITKWSICIVDPTHTVQRREAKDDKKSCNRRQRKRSLPLYPTYADVNEALTNMTQNVGNLDIFTQETVDFLEMVEQGRINPTYLQLNILLQNLLKASFFLSSTSSGNKVAVASTLFNCTGAVYFFARSYCSGTSLDRNQALTILYLVLKVYQVLSGPLSPTSTGMVIENSVATVTTFSQTPKELSGSTVGKPGSGGYFKMPSFSTLGPLLNQYNNITTEIVNFKVNPYPEDSRENITGTVCSLTLSSNTEELHIRNLEEQIEIFLPRPNPPALSLAIVQAQGDALITTSFNTSDTNHTIVVRMMPSEEVTFMMQLAYEGPPNATNIINTTVVDSEVMYTWLITPEMMWAGNGTWYVQASILQPRSGLNISVEITVFPTKCLFWNNSLETWSTMGCVVGIQSEINQTQCLCNHLTTFGSSIFVMPNQVDLSRTAEYFATVKDNYVVTALLSAFFGAYLLVLAWACYADRQASRQRKITWLGDSTFCAQYCYLLSVHTGHRSGAGTSAQVEVTLVGTDGESETIHLRDPHKPVFQRGGVDMFLLTTPFPLGELQSIRVSHDNSGGHPSWYLSKIMIQDLQTRQHWFFLCATWLSSGKGDGMTKKTFHVAPTSQITSFGNIFQTRTSNGFRDEHIWMSVVDPPRRSPFTRAQRVSCCMCILLCTMAINIMFWNIPEDGNSPVIFSVGSMKFTLAEFMVGVESGLLMFPINILIITIFRSTKPRQSPAKDMHDTMQDHKAPPATMLTFLKDTEKFITSLSKCPKNNITALETQLEKWSDLFPALDRVQGLLQLLQVEKENDFHWVYCSQFVFFSLRRLAEAFNKLDMKDFHWQENYWKLHSTITHLLKQADMVATRYMEKGPNTSEPETEKRKGCWLPWWFVFVGWFLLLSISAVSTYFTLIYGFTYGKESSIKWVISLALSLFQSIFVLQPLKVVGVAIFFALIVKTMAVEDSDEANHLLAEQRKKIAAATGKALP